MTIQSPAARRATSCCTMESCALKCLSLLKSRIKSSARLPGNSSCIWPAGQEPRECFSLFCLFLFVIFGFPILALAGFLAFHQVNNRPFSEFLESAVNYFAKSRLYLWRKKNPQEVLDKVASPLVVEAPAQAAHLPKPSVNNIASLSRQLELQTLEPKK
jgi:hypothetical protein